MLFSSMTFLFCFLPLTLGAYFLVPEGWQNGLLLAASLIFYGWGEPTYILLMLVSIVQGYFFGLLMERYRGTQGAKLCFVLSLAVSLGLLGYFKYADFAVDTLNQLTGLGLPLPKVALPIGISFYTFQIISYLADVYRGQVRAQRSFVRLAAYISMFPQLIAGPIVRYHDIEAQLDHRNHTLAGTALGARRFVFGLSKKVLLANPLGEFTAAFKAAAQPSWVYFLAYALACCLQIYFDFSGYSDMAIGLGKILGFDFPENFDYPFLSANVTQFWRRWHISLGSWFRDYLYIPLGGSRVGPWRLVFNLLVVWLATGLWHGAAWNFVVWGLLFGLLLMVEKIFLLKALKNHPIVSHIYLLAVVVVSFVIFDSASLGALGQTLVRLAESPLVNGETLYQLRNYGVIFALGIVGSTPLPKRLARWLDEKLPWAEPVALTALLALCTAFLVDGSFNPFLYFRF